VEEYYLYDPEHGTLRGWQRQGHLLLEIPRMEGWTSPRLGVRFELEGIELRVSGSNGERFLSDKERDAVRKAAESRAEAAESRAAAAESRTAQLAARLRTLGFDPDV
jgi:hypothetical protein